MGRAALHEVLLLPELELVAARVYDPDKNGRDLGNILGLAPTGVIATDDSRAFIASRPDCVIHAARDFGDYLADDEIVQLLKAGITVLPFHYLDMCEAGAKRRIEAAALKGGASFYASGINPGFIFERLALILTGLSNDIRKISLTEVVNTEHMPGAGAFLALTGFGMPGVSPEAVEPVAEMVANYLKSYLYIVAEQMGREIDRIDREDHHVPSPVILTFQAPYPSRRERQAM